MKNELIKLTKNQLLFYVFYKQNYNYLIFNYNKVSKNLEIYNSFNDLLYIITKDNYFRYNNFTQDKINKQFIKEFFN